MQLVKDALHVAKGKLLDELQDPLFLINSAPAPIMRKVVKIHGAQCMMVDNGGKLSGNAVV